MNRPKQPCLKNCPERSAECHTVCEKWKRYELLRAEFYKARGVDAEQTRVLNEIERDRKADIATGRMRRRKSKK